jgi:FKBP-type peptidyl-prolyl cis-trans isomerase FkpA
MKIIFSLLVVVILFSCGRKKEQIPLTETEINEKLSDMNRQLVVDESRQIEEFIKRHQFHMQMTGTGLRYEVYVKHGHQKTEKKEKVTIGYKLWNLDGNEIYSKDSLVVNIGKNEIPRGLEEGILLMEEGDKARLVLPSHLAFGMSGDGNKIPPASTLYFEVELKKIND